MSEKDVISYHKKQSLTIQAVQKHRTATDKLSQVSKALPLKWLTKKHEVMAYNKRETAGFRITGTGATRY